MNGAYLSLFFLFTVTWNFEEKQVIASLEDMPVYGEERLIETTHLNDTAQPFLSEHNPSVTALSPCSVSMATDFQSTQNGFLLHSFTICAFKR